MFWGRGYTRGIQMGRDTPHERDEKNHVGEKTALWVHWSSGRLVESRFGFSFFSHEQFLVLAVLSENGPPSVHTHRLGMYIRLPI